MAKLPDIRNTSVERLQSAKMAALPGELRAINARTQAARQGVNAIDKALETEARLDAGRRFQQARQDYARSRAELVQEYHTTDKPLENFQGELTAARKEAFSGSMPQAGRTQKYYRPDMDAFETQAVGDELTTFQRLTESRSKFHLENSSTDLIETARVDPSQAITAIDTFEFGLTGNGLGQETNRAFRAKHTQGVMTEAITGLLEAGRVDEAAALTQSKQFENVPQNARLVLEQAVTKASYASMDDFVQESANNLLIGQGDLSELTAALSLTEGKAGKLANLTEHQQQELSQVSQGELAFRYFQGQIMEGNDQLVDTALKSGEYSSVLSTAQTKQLMSSLASGVAIHANRERVGYKREIGAVIGSLAMPGIIDFNAIGEAETAHTKLVESYTRVGKEPPEAVYNLGEDLADAKAKYHRKARIFADPSVASDVLTTTTADYSVEARTQRFEAAEALVERADLVATDPVAFKVAMGATTNHVPPPTEEGHFEALALRFNDYDVWRVDEGDNIGGPMSKTELSDITRALNQMDVPQQLAYGAALSETLGVDNALLVLDQLYEGDNVGVIPSASRAAAWGDSETARMILEGNAILADPTTSLKPTEMTKVDAQILAELEGAYGPDWEMLDRTVDAVRARYVAYMASEGGGDFSHNATAVTDSVQRVTGGTFEFEGRTFVAPRPDVTKQQFELWASSFGPETLPAMADMKGNPIPPEDLRAGLYDGNIFTSTRFQLQPAGPPGMYYIQDNRSFRGVGRGSTANPNLGALIQDADHPRQPAVVRFDPANIRQRNVGRRRP